MIEYQLSHDEFQRVKKAAAIWYDEDFRSIPLWQTNVYMKNNLMEGSIRYEPKAGSYIITAHNENHLTMFLLKV